MTQAAEELRERLAGLPRDDRAELAEFLIGSLGEDEDEGAAEEWDRELRRRHREIVSGEVVGIPADEVFKRLRAGLR